MVNSPKYKPKSQNTQIQSDNLNTLEDRGIAKSAHEANWQAIGNRWHYPIYNIDGDVIATRTKAINPDDKYKYLWEGGKPKNADVDWYILPGTTSAIRESGDSGTENRSKQSLDVLKI